MVLKGPMSDYNSAERLVNRLNVTGFKSEKVRLALNHQKWPETGPEWSPGSENPPKWIARPFPSLWDRSRGPKPNADPEKFTWYPANED